MKTQQLAKVIWLFSSIILFMNSCTSYRSNDNRKTRIPMESKTNIVLTITPTKEILYPTKSLIPKPTNKPITTRTTTIIPTLNSVEKEKFISQLLTGDYSCELPCFGGIIPGQTMREDAIAFLDSFSEIYTHQLNDQEITNYASVDYLGKPAFVYLYSKNGIVEFISTLRFNYPLQKLLREYGKPDEVYFNIVDILPYEYTNPYSMYIFYKEKGIIAYYLGESIKGSSLSICARKVDKKEYMNAFLSLWIEDLNRDFEYIGQTYIDKETSFEISHFKTLEEISTYSIDDFSEIFLNSNNTCIKIKNPNNTWQLR